MTSRGLFQSQLSCESMILWQGTKTRWNLSDTSCPTACSLPTTWLLIERREKARIMLQMWPLWISPEFNYKRVCFVGFLFCFCQLLQGKHDFCKPSLFKYHSIFSQVIIGCRYKVEMELADYGKKQVRLANTKLLMILVAHSNESPWYILLSQHLSLIFCMPK